MATLSHRRYLRTLALSLLAGIGLVTALVVVADPYDLFGIVRAPGVNAKKPVPHYFRNEIKLARAQRVAARQFLVGNSRVEVGFDPDSPQFGGSAYNLGLAGTGTTVAVGQLAYLRRSGVRPTRVVAGVDFHDSLLRPGERAGIWNTPPMPAPPWRWRFETTFSLGAVRAAAATLTMQGNDEAESMTPRGLNPLHEYAGFVRHDGYYKIFRQRAEEGAAMLVQRAPYGLDHEGARKSIRALLEVSARDNPGAEVHLLVYAYHAQLLAMYEASGVWPLFEQWKTILQEEAEAGRARYPQARIVVHDFSGFGKFNCEPIPAPGKGGSTRWYWEAGHQKPALGEEMLRRMLAPDAVQGDGFGMELTAQSAVLNRQRIAAERAQCQASQPGLFGEAQELVARASKQ
ncbi:hypothetical protein ABT364_25565 [Massilia sp. SR12]